MRAARARATTSIGLPMKKTIRAGSARYQRNGKRMASGPAGRGRNGTLKNFAIAQSSGLSMKLNGMTHSALTTDTGTTGARCLSARVTKLEEKRCSWYRLAKPLPMPGTPSG